MENPSAPFCAFGYTYRTRNATKGIICQVTSDQQDIDQVCQILELIYETVSDATLCELATAEVLAKVMAYRNLAEGQSFLIPTMNGQGLMELFPYKVDRVFDLEGAVWGFGLVNVHDGKGSPILLFRGTDFSVFSEGGRTSIISDFDPKGPGRTLFEKVEPDVQVFLRCHVPVKGRARMIGHSLGGVLLSYALIHEHGFMSQNDHEMSYAFNFPGVSEDLFRRWNEIPEVERPVFKGFVCRGDVISKFGMLFGDVYEVSYRKSLSPVRAHEQLLFAQPTCYVQSVDVAKENECEFRQFYSKVHRKASSMIYEFGLKFLFPR